MIPAGVRIYSDVEPKDIAEFKESDISVSGAGWSEITKSAIESVKSEEVEKKALFTLTTVGGHSIAVSPEHTLFARMDHGMRFFSVFLQERSSMGFRLGVCYDLINDLASPSSCKGELTGKEDREIIDRYWIIENAGTINEANFIQKLAVYRYGIPDIPFVARLTDMVSIGQEYTKLVFDNVDTPSKAAELLKDSYMFENNPHITMRLSSHEPPISNSIQLTIFGGDEKSKDGVYTNLIQISGAKDSNIKSEGNAVYRHPGRHGSWQLSITRDDLEEAELFVKTLSHLDNLEVVKKIQLTKKNPYYIMPASHIKRGMMVPILIQNGVLEEDIVESVNIMEYSGVLYTPSVAKFKNIIANGWFIGA